MPETQSERRSLINQELFEITDEIRAAMDESRIDQSNNFRPRAI